MNTKLSPIESEPSATEEAEAYEHWFRTKVQESLDDNSPLIPHAQVMAEMQELLDALAKNRARARLPTLHKARKVKLDDL